MQTEVVAKLFPLLATAKPETITTLLSVATTHEYPADRAVMMEDAWGNAVYFLVSGWVKVRRHSARDGDTSALAILGRGDIFGEMAIMDESPRSTDVVALSPVQLLSVPAEPFVQCLFQDHQFHHTLLQLMVRRLRQTNYRFQLRHQPPSVKLIYTLAELAEVYGKVQARGVREILHLSSQDLADVSDVSLEEATKILDKLMAKGWIQADPAQQVMHILHTDDMKQFLEKVGG
jgi:CRP-like cAMP-binding protein